MEAKEDFNRRNPFAPGVTSRINGRALCPCSVITARGCFESFRGSTSFPPWEGRRKKKNQPFPLCSKNFSLQQKRIFMYVPSPVVDPWLELKTCGCSKVAGQWYFDRRPSLSGRANIIKEIP